MKNICKAVVFDLDGTLYIGESEVPGARKTLYALEAAGLRVAYFTNNSSLSGADYSARLKKFGFPSEPERIVTSGDAALGYLQQRYPGRRILVFGTSSMRAAFPRELLDDETPEAAVIGLNTEMTYADLVKLCNAVQRGIPFVATHADRSCPSEPFPIPDAGSILALVEAATGRVPEAVCGKPSAEAGAYLARRLGLRPEEIVFVGDRYSTDILLAKNSGFRSVQVLTGAREADEPRGPADLILPSVADLPEYL